MWFNIFWCVVGAGLGVRYVWMCRRLALQLVENEELRRANRYLAETFGIVAPSRQQTLSGLRSAVVELVRAVAPAGMHTRVTVCSVDPTGRRLGYDIVVDVAAVPLDDEQPMFPVEAASSRQ